MAHLVETEFNVEINNKTIMDKNQLVQFTSGVKNEDILVFSLPKEISKYKDKFLFLLDTILDKLSKDITIGIIGENDDLAYLSYALETNLGMEYKLWIALRKSLIENNEVLLPNETAGAVFFTRKKKRLKIARVLLPYTYCPACNKTTKDYGGKKHTFHHYGTTMSDVWKDIILPDEEPFPTEVIDRISAMFAKADDRTLHVYSLYNFKEWEETENYKVNLPKIQEVDDNVEKVKMEGSRLFQGDSLEVLKTIPSKVTNYVFVDPPYNLKKKYASYEDSLEIEDYFTWCDKWLEQCIRTLKPGGYLSILNIPNWSIRHYAYLFQNMIFESWITWDALSKPSGNIMPANYTILTFKKPDETLLTDNKELGGKLNSDEDLKALADYYCLRAPCKKKREPMYKPLTDLWTDIHRLKHNSKRFNHPCQLPPNLLKRLIKLYSDEGDYVLDCFNGVGTTSLCANLLNRKYIGIELDEYYHEVAMGRHNDISEGLDPFRKNEMKTEEKAKNNTVKRIEKRKKEHSHLTKKQVQLQVKDLGLLLGRVPNIEDALQHLPHIPEEFYELYFASWSEVIVAVKVDGVKEDRHSNNKGSISTKRHDILSK